MKEKEKEKEKKDKERKEKALMVVSFSCSVLNKQILRQYLFFLPHIILFREDIFARLLMSVCICWIFSGCLSFLRTALELINLKVNTFTFIFDS